MTKTEIIKHRDAILSCINGQQLSQAIEKLSQLVATAPDATLRERLDQVKMSYDFMLSYLSQGVLDPQRDDVLSHIVNELSVITEQCVVALLERESPEVFYARRRELGHIELDDLLGQYRTLVNKTSLLLSVDTPQRNHQALLQVTHQRERLETTIFNKVWSSFPTTKGDAELIEQFLADESMPMPARCLVVMALLLGLMKFYDETKLTLLIDTYTTSQEVEVQVRAIIGVLLTMNSYRQHVNRSRTLQRHIEAMTEAPAFVNDVAMVMYRLISTRNTDRVTRQVTQEIMPDIIKASPDLMRKLRDRRAEIDPDELEGNPEWQQMLEDNGIADKMEQFSQMQQEGSDVFISTFSRLKSFPFFQTLSNWFLPYHSDHTVVQESFGEQEKMMRDMIAQAPFLCNSDRYSFCLTLSSMPESQRQMIVNQTRQQMESIAELDVEQAIEKRNQRRDTIATRCVQDLYRFFKLFSRRSEFLAAMDTEMDFTGLPYLSSYTDAPETLLVIAEFYLKNEFYHDAIKYFEHLLGTQEQTTPIVYQKLGFAHERLGNLQEALKQFERYELANDNDLWTLRHIASCCRALHMPDKALEYYERIDRIKPNQVSTTLNMGHALLENGRVDEALHYYFKADLIDETKHRAWRPIAWCSFLLGNDERSLDYNNRIIDSGKPTMSDYVNRGHVHLCNHEIVEAIADYRQAQAMAGDDGSALRDAVLADLPHLRARGIDDRDAWLVIDASLMNSKL